jgi:hypothetical protein
MALTGGTEFRLALRSEAEGEREKEKGRKRCN